MHNRIIRKQIEGTINSDSDIPRMTQHFKNLLITSMRDEGLIPVLDLNAQFSLKYIEEHYEFLLTMHFVKVGKEGANKWEGMSEGKPMPRSIPQRS